MMNVQLNMFLLLTSFALATYLVSGDNQFQALLSTFECFKFEQEGCNTDFTDAYPELSMSYTNLTKAATRFYLFTPKNVYDPELIHKCGGFPPPNTNFNPECKTLFVFPGFVSGICISAIYRELVYQRMKCGCYNYIHIEWTWGNSFDLITAVKNIKIVAKQTVVVIRNLKEKYGLKARDITCTGHSLGAHGCGFIGQEEEIFAIHGLDPAGVVYWEDMPLDERLDPGDAPCVMATHCNGGQCLPKYFGVNFTLGTKDFIFNDGLHQPACLVQTFISFLKGDLTYALASLIPAACNHFQCLQYYKTSICSPDCEWIGVECKNYDDFKSGRCDNCGSDGEQCALTGINSCECGLGQFKSYYLKAGLTCPYCDSTGIKNLDKFQCTGATEPTVPPSGCLFC